MQPYFMPYIGYLSLLSKVDVFVFLDDVNYIKKGWINRNTIYENGEYNRITIPLQNQSQNKLINEILLEKTSNEFLKIIKRLMQNYKKSKNSEILEDIINLLEIERYICELNIKLLKLTSALLCLDTKFVRSSELAVDNTGEQRLIDICSKLNANKYINLPGGANIYNADNFLRQNIDLEFIDIESMISINKKFGYTNFVSGLDLILCHDLQLIKNELVNASKFNQYN